MKISNWPIRAGARFRFEETTLIEGNPSLALVHTLQGEKIDRLDLTLLGDQIGYRVQISKEEVARMLDWYQKNKEN